MQLGYPDLENISTASTEQYWLCVASAFSQTTHTHTHTQT